MMQEMNYIRFGDYYISRYSFTGGKQTYWSMGTYAQRLH